MTPTPAVPVLGWARHTMNYQFGYFILTKPCRGWSTFFPLQMGKQVPKCPRPLVHLS